jgi:hypothetical protein
MAGSQPSSVEEAHPDGTVVIHRHWSSPGSVESCCWIHLRRQDRIDRGLEPGLTSPENTELLAVKCRIAELETELRAMRRAVELVREVVPPRKAVPAGWPNREHRHRGMRIQPGTQAERQGDTAGQHDGTVQPDRQLRLQRHPQLGARGARGPGSSNASAPPVTNIAARAARPTARRGTRRASIAPSR